MPIAPLRTVFILGCTSVWAHAPGALAASPESASPAPAWRQCASVADNQQRLACFDAWALQQQPHTPPPATAWTAPAAHASETPVADALPATLAPSPSTPAAALTPTNGGCRDPRYSELSRFYELEPGSDCGTFSFRGYKPLSVAITTSDRINRQPTSASKALPPHQDYGTTEMRIQLSARTKIAQGLLTGGHSSGKDSLWVGYSQQSYWQVFNSGLSRPFRSTDHEPEIFYVYPTQAQLPGGWRWRYTGIGLVHHSNGQSEPLSRSWNRWYVMTGTELGHRWQLHAKAWQRISESRDNDDNPQLVDHWGRGELRAVWNLDDSHTVALTARGSVGKGKGSGRLEWNRALGDGWNGGKSNLRLQVQLFSGYGDSLIDYNFKRTALSVGLSLVDF